MIDSDYLYKLEKISRENIQKNSPNPIRMRLRPVSNVVLLPCRTQFINNKNIGVHLKVLLTVSLFLCFVFSNSRSIRLN